MADVTVDVLVLWGDLQPATDAFFSRLAGHGWRIVFVSLVADRPTWAAEHLPRADAATLRRLLAGRVWAAALMTSWNVPSYMALARDLRCREVPVIAAMDNPWTGSVRQRLATLVARWWLRPRISELLCCGSAQIAFAHRLGYADPMRGMACNPAADPPLPSAARQRRFIYAGRLVAYKGIAQLLDGYRLYRQRSANPCELLVIGDGPEAHRLAAPASGVTWRGAQPHADVVAALRSSLAFTFPSDGEHWGAVVQEAAQAGCWLITCPTTWARLDMVREGVNGRLVLQEATAIADALVEAEGLGEPELALCARIGSTLGNACTAETAAAQVDARIRRQRA